MLTVMIVLTSYVVTHVKIQILFITMLNLVFVIKRLHKLLLFVMSLRVMVIQPQLIEDVKLKHVVDTHVRLGHQILHIKTMIIPQLKNQMQDLI
jgi:hypothetical protein